MVSTRARQRDRNERAAGPEFDQQIRFESMKSPALFDCAPTIYIDLYA
jgi:hypothetical protein